MPIESEFARGQSGLTRSSLDSLGPPAQAHSKIPDALTDGKVERDDAVADCDGLDANEAVCQIKKANDEAATKSSS